MYSVLRQYTPVVRSSVYESEQKEDLDPTRDLSRCEVMKVGSKKSKKVEFFWLQVSDGTHLLRRMKKIKCGADKVSIKWTRNVVVLKQAKTAADPPPPNLPLNVNGDYVLDSVQQQAFTEKFLCKIARTSYGDFAKKVFKARYEKSTIHLVGHKWSLQECEVLFMEYGPYITSMEIDASPVYTDIIVGFIAHYCPAIKSLQCCRIDALGRAIRGFEKLSKMKQKNATAPFRKLQELVCLSRKVVEMKLPSVKLPALRSFTLRGAVFRKREHVEPFFKKNDHLLTLALDMVNFRFQFSYILRNMPNLQQMHLQELRGVDDMAPRKNIKYLSRLRKLTTIKWRPRHDSLYLRQTMKAIFQADIPLKNADLDISTMNPAFIGRLANMDQLQLFGLEPETIPQVAAYIEKFPHLEKIENGQTGKNYMIGFKRIVRSMKNDLKK